MSNRPGEILGPVRKAGAPLIVTAELPADIFSWVNSLRVAHFPPERNRLQAHVTLFHALPAWVEDELADLMKALSRTAPPAARLTGVMDLGGGTALRIESAEMDAIRDTISERMHGLLTRQDAQPARLHVTIQNKVEPGTARALQAALRERLEPRLFRFHGLGLHAYEDGLWRPLSRVTFHR